MRRTKGTKEEFEAALGVLQRIRANLSVAQLGDVALTKEKKPEQALLNNIKWNMYLFALRTVQKKIAQHWPEHWDEYEADRIAAEGAELDRYLAELSNKRSNT